MLRYLSALESQNLLKNKSEWKTNFALSCSFSWWTRHSAQGKMWSLSLFLWGRKKRNKKKPISWKPEKRLLGHWCHKYKHPSQTQPGPLTVRPECETLRRNTKSLSSDLRPLFRSQERCVGGENILWGCWHLLDESRLGTFCHQIEAELKWLLVFFPVAGSVSWRECPGVRGGWAAQKSWTCWMFEPNRESGWSLLKETWSCWVTAWRPTPTSKVTAQTLSLRLRTQTLLWSWVSFYVCVSLRWTNWDTMISEALF